jgi:hypothetical protein
LNNNYNFGENINNNNNMADFKNLDVDNLGSANGLVNISRRDHRNGGGDGV